MRKIFLGFGLALLSMSGAFPMSVLSTDSGTSEDTVKKGVSDGIMDSIAKNAADWVANGMDKIGDWALNALFNIYDKYIGTFLIKNPDLASPQAYMALAKNFTGETSKAVSEVLNLLKITSGTGLFLLLVFFLIDVGQRASQFWGRSIDPGMVLSFVAAFTAIFAWPYIFSLASNAVTAMGYYIYNQNTLRTSGVLEGFANITLDGPSVASSVAASQIDFRGNFIKTQGLFWDFFFLLSLALVITGFYNCYSAVSSGDSKSGNHKFFQAVAGIILILGAPTLVHVLLVRGADQVGSSPAIPGETLVPYSVQGLIGENGINYPPQQGPQSANLGTAGVTTSAPDQSRMAKFGAGLLKCGAALWGLIVCFSVIFAKFFQVLNLWVLFLLGPVFIGCLGHPATAPLFWGALRYFVKLLLYSVIWAITLVGLYLIPNIDWGIETIGVNSLLTACAVIAGLQMISNAQEFAALFTTFHGGNLKGDGIKDFARDSMMAGAAINSVRLKAAGGLKAVTGETGQAVGTATGAAVGSIIPGLGTSAGALAGMRFVKGVNMLGQLGGLGGRERGGEGSDNPVSSLIRSFAGNKITGSLDREFIKHKGDFSRDEMEKRRLIASYAKRLQRGGAPTQVRGMGREKRGGDGDPA